MNVHAGKFISLLIAIGNQENANPMSSTFSTAQMETDV